MMTAIYKIENLTKIYKMGNVLANDNLSLEIRPGEIFGIFGPNGAGKTTLIRQMAGLIKPSSGSILLKGRDVVKNPAMIPNYVSYFAQAPWILWSLKVWETIYFTGIFRGMSKAAAREQTEQLMAELGLTDIRDRLMETISGGQSKLLGIAAALIGDSPVLIMDEPTNELDPVNRSKVWNILSRLCREKKITVILVTHNVLEAENVVDRVMIVDNGKIIAEGTPGELKKKVDDRVRLEITFKPEHCVRPDFLLDAVEVKEGKWRIFIPKKDLAATQAKIFQHLDIDQVDDFRLMTTTLEDVYIKMGGIKQDEFHA